MTYCIKSIYLSPRNNFGSNGEGYIRFALCVKEEKNTRGD
jgi:aspartate/methionine/tyrosine aminotransferase